MTGKEKSNLKNQNVKTWQRRKANISQRVMMKILTSWRQVFSCKPVFYFIVFVFVTICTEALLSTLNNITTKYEPFGNSTQIAHLSGSRNLNNFHRGKLPNRYSLDPEISTNNLTKFLEITKYHIFETNSPHIFVTFTQYDGTSIGDWNIHDAVPYSPETNYTSPYECIANGTIFSLGDSNGPVLEIKECEIESFLNVFEEKLLIGTTDISEFSSSDDPDPISSEIRIGFTTLYEKLTEESTVRNTDTKLLESDYSSNIANIAKNDFSADSYREEIEAGKASILFEQLQGPKTDIITEEVDFTLHVNIAQFTKDNSICIVETEFDKEMIEVSIGDIVQEDMSEIDHERETVSVAMTVYCSIHEVSSAISADEPAYALSKLPGRVSGAECSSFVADFIENTTHIDEILITGKQISNDFEIGKNTIPTVTFEEQSLASTANSTGRTLTAWPHFEPLTTHANSFQGNEFYSVKTTTERISYSFEDDFLENPPGASSILFFGELAAIKNNPRFLQIGGDKLNEISNLDEKLTKSSAERSDWLLHAFSEDLLDTDIHNTENPSGDEIENMKEAGIESTVAEFQDGITGSHLENTAYAIHDSDEGMFTEARGSLRKYNEPSADALISNKISPSKDEGDENTFRNMVDGNWVEFRTHIDYYSFEESDEVFEQFLEAEGSSANMNKSSQSQYAINCSLHDSKIICNNDGDQLILDQFLQNIVKAPPEKDEHQKVDLDAYKMEATAHRLSSAMAQYDSNLTKVSNEIQTFLLPKICDTNVSGFFTRHESSSLKKPNGISSKFGQHLNQAILDLFKSLPMDEELMQFNTHKGFGELEKIVGDKTASSVTQFDSGNTTGLSHYESMDLLCRSATETTYVPPAESCYFNSSRATDNRGLSFTVPGIDEIDESLIQSDVSETTSTNRIGIADARYLDEFPETAIMKGLTLDPSSDESLLSSVENTRELIAEDDEEFAETSTDRTGIAEGGYHDGISKTEINIDFNLDHFAEELFVPSYGKTESIIDDDDEEFVETSTDRTGIADGGYRDKLPNTEINKDIPLSGFPEELVPRFGGNHGAVVQNDENSVEASTDRTGIADGGYREDVSAIGIYNDVTLATSTKQLLSTTHAKTEEVNAEYDDESVETSTDRTGIADGGYHEDVSGPEVHSDITLSIFNVQSSLPTHRKTEEVVADDNEEYVETSTDRTGIADGGYHDEQSENSITLNTFDQELSVPTYGKTEEPIIENDLESIETASESTEIADGEYHQKSSEIPDNIVEIDASTEELIVPIHEEIEELVAGDDEDFVETSVDSSEFADGEYHDELSDPTINSNPILGASAEELLTPEMPANEDEDVGTISDSLTGFQEHSTEQLLEVNTHDSIGSVATADNDSPEELKHWVKFIELIEKSCTTNNENSLLPEQIPQTSAHRTHKNFD